ncbi:hypothetical protein [Endozoicomonas sp. ONNA2]|uniref:hypothetical protein n=1 Tax=Endozoicomonas sp. ONNA2 TaxID=2828741 RepID=UPI002148FBE2|nr:hypothetical protein [Endozoicomonas sp. ONNA2]
MNPYQLNGQTPEILHEIIMTSSIGFSAEDGAIQYLGRQIELHGGTTELSEQTFNTAGSKQLLERLVDLQPDIKTKLSNSKSKAIQMAARKLWDEFQYGAIERSPTKEVLCAVFIESSKFGSTNMASKLAETNSLTGAEKLQVMLAANEQDTKPLTGFCWRLAGIPFSTRFEGAKNLFQRLPDTPSMADELVEIHEGLTAFACDKLIRDSLLEIRKILESENNELARQLLSEVDNIEKKFIPRVNESGQLSRFEDNDDFNVCIRRLLFLYAACSGYSNEADIAELTSYIRSVLYITDSCIWHIVKELAYLSKQPNSIDYCRYIHAVAILLKAPAHTVSQFENLKQLSDVKGFALLESKPLDKYLTALRANIGNMTPEYSPVLIPAVNQLETNVATTLLPEGKLDIKAQVHRLLMVIAACKSSRQIMDISVLTLFVDAIMAHGNKKNIPYLISGLARLVQSTPKIQQLLGEPVIKGGPHLRLAPLQLLAFVPDIISEANVEELNKYLQKSSTGRRQLRDGKVFHQWLATLEQALANKLMNKTLVMPILKKLTQNLTYEKLGLLHMTFKMGDRFNEFLDSLGFSCQKEGLPLLIAEIGSDALMGTSKGVSQWLFEQRYYHLLPSYMASVIEFGNTEITELTREFIKSIADNTFIQTRQSPLNNPHLQAVYKIYPKFQAGWGKNFSHFSETTKNKLVSPRETLELTEDPWDLFISGLEATTCLSPAKSLYIGNKALMSYVMDGRNAMIVRKSQKGNIQSRSVIRMVLDQDDRPALFLEKAYPEVLYKKTNLMFIDAARDIAKEMELPLYYHVYSEKGETVKLLEGKAPFDYFDSLDLELIKRQQVTLTKVQRDVKQS